MKFMETPIVKNDNYQQKQSAISIVLIVTIMALAVIFMNCTYSTENENILHTVLVAPVLTLLLGAYIITYRGREYRIAKIIFFILLAISALMIAGHFYLISLARAYAH